MGELRALPRPPIAGFKGPTFKGREGFLLPIWLEGAATQTFAPGGKNPRAATAVNMFAVHMPTKSNPIYIQSNVHLYSASTMSLTLDSQHTTGHFGGLMSDDPNDSVKAPRGRWLVNSHPDSSQSLLQKYLSLELDGITDTGRPIHK